MWLNRYGWPFGLFLAAAFFANHVDSQEPPDATRPDLRITASPRTTVLTEPLRHDGYVDYIAAVNRIASQGVTPENNAAVPFIRALGSVCVGDMDPDRFYPLLGIEPLPEEGEYFVPLDRYAATRSTGTWCSNTSTGGTTRRLRLWSGRPMRNERRCSSSWRMTSEKPARTSSRRAASFRHC